MRARKQWIGRVRVAIGMVVLCAAALGCSSNTGDDRNSVTVLAAASLTSAFTEIGEAFEAAGDLDVTFSFAGSSELAAQILQGAPVDVFASADVANITRLADADVVAGEPVVFATNVAEILVEAGNPLGVTDLADVADLAAAGELVLVQCAPEVPCGAYAERVAQNAGITATPSSLEENVNAVVAKVRLGEADAGIVYRTDVLATGDAATGVPIPADVNIVAEYPVVAVTDAPNPPGADAFVEFLLGPTGQEILSSYGFGAP